MSVIDREQRCTRHDVKRQAKKKLQPYIRKRAIGNGFCSEKTRHERVLFIGQVVDALWDMGYKIQSLESLKVKHIEVLMQHWYEKQICMNTLHTRLSMLRLFCSWLGKENVVRPISEYFPDGVTRRVTAAQVSKSFQDNALDPLKMIRMAREVDPRLAVMLELQHHFGLRVKESLEFRPYTSVIEKSTMLVVKEGTKGGRLRFVPIETDEQRQVLKRAFQFAKQSTTKRLRWPDKTFNQSQNRFYNLMKKLGITKFDLGVTAHGFRHGYAQEKYEEQTDGLPCPVRGGALGRIDRETHTQANITVSHRLGHSRTVVTSSYCGTYGHALRTATSQQKPWELKTDGKCQSNMLWY